MMEEQKKIQHSANEAIDKAATIDDVEKMRIDYLGRERGALTFILRGLKELTTEERKEIGSRANDLREEIELALGKKLKQLKKTSSESVLKKEWIDVSRPGIREEKGHLHPLTKITREAIEIFSSMGFEVAEGPEAESEYYNFDALNIPANHPSRDMWDTFWIKSRLNVEVNTHKNGKEFSANPAAGLLLRTHTSPVQIRYMEKHNPPIRIIAPGRTYRYEATDASHDFQFVQLEGLMVDKSVSIANFKAVIKEFFSKFFKTIIEIRLRPSYFPFVEPGFEVDISCTYCKEKGCAVCKKTGWLELAGAGMVHPNVFKAAGYNPKEFQGFAFGFGLDRLAMMKYKINDIRLLRAGDLRFLKQF